jgi:DNA-binding transcriptional LysR family regulator
MEGITLQQLACFDALVAEGSFQAAAQRLSRTHPTVQAAVRNLEIQAGVALLDRDGYRVVLTEQGRAFHRQVQAVLRQTETLKSLGRHLAMGEEPSLSIVIGDLCPLENTLALLQDFFKANPATRFDLHFDAIGGPAERLAEGEADLMIHHVEPGQSTLEVIPWFGVALLPVAAPALLAECPPQQVTPDLLLGLVQCVIRDTARHSATRSYFTLPGARQLTVADQLMKRQVILSGLGWGHMPHTLVDDDLRQGRLVCFRNAAFPGGRAELVAARRRDRPHGPVASRLWQFLGQRLPRSGDVLQQTQQVFDPPWQGGVDR